VACESLTRTVREELERTAETPVVRVVEVEVPSEAPEELRTGLTDRSSLGPPAEAT